MSIKVFRHSEEKHQKFEKYSEIISTDNRKLWKIRTNTVRKQNLPKQLSSKHLKTRFLDGFISSLF